MYCSRTSKSGDYSDGFPREGRGTPADPRRLRRHASGLSRTPPRPDALVGEHWDAEGEEPEEAEEQRGGARCPPPELPRQTGRAPGGQAAEGPLAVTAPHAELRSGETDSVLYGVGSFCRVADGYHRQSRACQRPRTPETAGGMVQKTHAPGRRLPGAHSCKRVKRLTMRQAPWRHSSLMPRGMPGLGLGRRRQGRVSRRR